MNSFFVTCSGIVLGGIVTIVWSVLGRWFADNSFWRSTREVADKLMSAPPEEFFRHYGLLVQSLAVYLFKTGCRVTISILPVMIVMCLFWPMMATQQLNLATHLEVYPPQDLVVRVSDQTVASRPNGSCDIPVQSASQAAEISASDWSFSVSSLAYPVALSNSQVTRVALLLCGFKVHGSEHFPPLLIMRPSAGDANPLWPYLSDLEFSFWLAMFGASLVVGAVMKWAPLRLHKATRAGPERKQAAAVVLQPLTDELPQ